MVFNINTTLNFFLKILRFLQQLSRIYLQSFTYFTENQMNDSEYLLCSVEEFSTVSQRMSPSDALAIKVVFNITYFCL